MILPEDDKTVGKKTDFFFFLHLDDLVINFNFEGQINKNSTRKSPKKESNEGRLALSISNTYNKDFLIKTLLYFHINRSIEWIIRNYI